MTDAHRTSTDRTHPAARPACLDEPLARRLDPRDRDALRERLARAVRTAAPDRPLLVADGLPVGRFLPHGSLVLYRPDPSAPLALRLLDIDRAGRVTAALARA